MKFKDLEIYRHFTMPGTSFDLGRVYRKTGNRTYSQIDKTGGLQGPVFRVGSIRVEVTPCAAEDTPPAK